jgi:hypothetical protein
MKMFASRFTVAAMLLTLPAPSLNAAVAQDGPVGTGLVLDNLTSISLPLVGDVGDVIIDQAVITDLKLIEDLAGQIIGLEATGRLTGTLTATGVQIVDERFTSTLGIISAGPGQCELVRLDLGALNLDALGLVTVDVPELDVTGKGSGAVGALLCTLGELLSGVIGGVTQGVQGVINAINRVI